MAEMTRLRRVGQGIFLLGLLGWGFGISYSEAGADTNALVLFAVGTVVMLAGIAVIVRESNREEE